MKTIHILYNQNKNATDAEAASIIAESLEKKGYIVQRVIDVSGQDSEGDYIDGIIKENPVPTDQSDESAEYTPQCIISLNMAGFGIRMSDGSAYINLLPLNILVWLDKYCDEYNAILSQRINVTTEIITGDERIYNRLKDCSVRIIPKNELLSIEEALTDHLGKMPWRF